MTPNADVPITRHAATLVRLLVALLVVALAALGVAVALLMHADLLDTLTAVVVPELRTAGEAFASSEQQAIADRIADLRHLAGALVALLAVAATGLAGATVLARRHTVH